MLQLPPLVIDFETYYDREYSLNKLSTAHYVLHPDFEVIGFSYGEPDGPVEWFTGSMAECGLKLKTLQLEHRTVVAHNARFDGAILEWIFGIQPRGYFCTAMGSRAYVAPFTGSASLATCAEFLELPTRKGAEVNAAMGHRRKDFDANGLISYGRYCSNDVRITAEVFKWITLRMPEEEQELLDLTVKKFTRGKFVLDKELLLQAKEDIANDEAKALMLVSSLGLKKLDVTSNVRFADALRSRGVVVPMKQSPTTTGKTTYAFSKKDPEFLRLKTHPDPEVRTLVAARLQLKSSIERTRVEAFLKIAEKIERMPIPLQYYGAHTGRFSGTDGINMQNLPRNSALRRALKAPDGYKVVSVDLSAIEARITATLAGQSSLVHSFKVGRDVYSEFASVVYNYPVSKEDPATKVERFVGKTCILGLGFGMGVNKYIDTLQAAGVLLPPEQAEGHVAIYRNTYPHIPRLWRQMDAVLTNMAQSNRNKGWYGWSPYPDFETPLLKIHSGYLVLPNGMPIYYPSLARDRFNKLTYRSYNGPGSDYRKPIWGGALTENIVQALARIIIARAEVRLAKAGLESALQVHDELVYVVPEQKAKRVAEIVSRVVTDPVPWLPNLPLACEVGIGDSYGDAK